MLGFAHGVHAQFLNFTAGHSVTRRKASKNSQSSLKTCNVRTLTNFQNPDTCRWREGVLCDLTYNLESANDLTKHWSFLTVKSSLQLGEITLEKTKSSQGLYYVSTKSQHELDSIYSGPNCFMPWMCVTSTDWGHIVLKVHHHHACKVLHNLATMEGKERTCLLGGCQYRLSTEHVPISRSLMSVV